jgi:hypothetical protein
MWRSMPLSPPRQNQPNVVRPPPPRIQLTKTRTHLLQAAVAAGRTQHLWWLQQQLQPHLSVAAPARHRLLLLLSRRLWQVVPVAAAVLAQMLTTN